MAALAGHFERTGPERELSGPLFSELRFETPHLLPQVFDVQAVRLPPQTF